MTPRSFYHCKWSLSILYCLAAIVTAARATAEEMPDDPHRPGAITTAGVPLVPPTLFERLMQYQDTRAATFLGWAPAQCDEGGMLINTRFGNAPQLHRVYTAGGRREQLTFYNEPVIGRFIPNAADGAMLFSMSEGGDENLQIYLLDRAAYRTTLLTDGKSRNLLGPVERSGKRMIVHSNQRNGRDTDMFIADTRQPDSLKPLYESNGEYWVATDWSADGGRLLMNRYVSINESYPALFDIASKELKPLPVPGEGKVSFGSLVFSQDGRSAYVTCDARSEFLQLARLDLETLKYEWLTDDIAWNVLDVVVDPLKGTVVFAINDDGASRLFVLEGRQHRELKVPLGIVTNIEFSPDGRELGFTLARPDAPADAYTCQLSDGKLAQWTFSEVGGLDPASFVAPERIQFPSFDGRQIPAYYYKPRRRFVGTSRAGVDQHSRRARGSIPAPLFRHYAIRIGSNGRGGDLSQRPRLGGLRQVVFEARQRGSARRQRARYRRPAGLDRHAARARRLARGRHRRQLRRVYGARFTGEFFRSHSRGHRCRGNRQFHHALGAHQPLSPGLAAGRIWGRAERRDAGRVREDQPREPGEKIRSALLVAHGENDPRVPFSEAEQIAAKVRAAGRSVWTVYADNEGHGFLKKDNRDFLMAVEVLFLSESLK